MAWLGHPTSFIIHQSLWILKKNVTVPLVSQNLLKHTWFDVHSHMTWYEDIDKELIFKVHYVAGWLSSELFITTCSQQSFDNLKNHTITVWTLYTYTSCTWKILDSIWTLVHWTTDIASHSFNIIHCLCNYFAWFIYRSVYSKEKDPINPPYSYYTCITYSVGWFNTYEILIGLRKLIYIGLQVLWVYVHESIYWNLQSISFSVFITMITVKIHVIIIHITLLDLCQIEEVVLMNRTDTIMHWHAVCLEDMRLLKKKENIHSVDCMSKLYRLGW